MNKLINGIKICFIIVVVVGQYQHLRHHHHKRFINVNIEQKSIINKDEFFGQF